MLNKKPRHWFAFLLAVGMFIASGSGIVPMARAASAEQQPPAPGPFVRQAFDLLMDRFVTPPSAATVLNGGWDGGVSFVREQTGAEVGDLRPSLGDDRASAWRAFVGAYPRLIAAADGIDQVEVDRVIVRGMAASLDSTSTYYYRPDDFQALQSGRTFAGIGVVTNRDLVVTELLEGGPAQAGGLRLGDRLIAVDGATIITREGPAFSPPLRGPAGSPVQVTIERVGSPDPVVLSFIRAPVQFHWITGRMIDNQIGYLRIRTLAPQGLDSLVRALAELDRGGARALVVDIRGNAGGAMSLVEEAAKRFVREGPLYRVIDRQGHEVVRRADASEGVYRGADLPTVVLVDQDTASGAELLAAVLRENGAGYLIGRGTAGMLAGQSAFSLADGSGLVVATQIIRTGQGKDIDGIGVEPDQLVGLDLTALAEGRDTQIEAALTYLRGRLGQQ